MGIILTVYGWPQASCQNHYFISGTDRAQVCLCQEGNFIEPGLTVAELWVCLSFKSLPHGASRALVLSIAVLEEVGRNVCVRVTS